VVALAATTFFYFASLPYFIRLIRSVAQLAKESSKENFGSYAEKKFTEEK
jgi:hypothetical protein